MGKSHSRKTNTQDEGRNKVQFGLLGEMRVGKTALVSQFLRHQVDPDYDPTLEDNYRKEIQLEADGKETLLSFQDITGQKEFSEIREYSIKNNKSFVLVYSITSKASFDEIRTFYEQIRRVKGQEFPIGILIGNKTDLESERKVSTEEGQNLGIDLRLPFLETSAYDKTNVQEMFQLIASHTIYGDTNYAKNIKSAR